MSLKQGFAAEEQAKGYLLKQGLCFVTENYHSRCGEIDLIMKEKDCLVFVEVRFRASAAYGGALSSVTHRKRQKLMKTASFYLLESKIKESLPVRFDVISLEGLPPKITWVKNAFGTNF